MSASAPRGGLTTMFTGGEGSSGSLSAGGRRSDALKREHRIGLAFVSPWLIGLVLLFAAPILVSLGLSFTDYELVDTDNTPSKFVGFDNWRRLFGDGEARHGAWVTMKFAAIAVPLSMIFPLFLAYLMSSKFLRAKGIFRTLFFLPSMVPGIAAMIIWGYFLNPSYGWLSKLIGQIGIDMPDMRASPGWAMVPLWLMGLWGVGNAMVIHIAALDGVPTDLYEAAMLDGASKFRQFRSVTFPMISPILFYNLIITLVGIGSYFILPYTLTNGTGSPGRSLSFYTMHFYTQTFKIFDAGYGATLAWMMFIVVFGLTVAVFWSAKFWVYYPYEEK